MRRNRILLTIIFLALGGCSPKRGITDSGSGGSSLSDYLPLKPGNTWTYSSFTVNNAGPIDTSAPSPLVLAIFQANLLVGGEPNAFIVRSDDKRGNVSYLAFSVNKNTLLHYLGAGSTFDIEDNFILWDPGGIGGAVVGVMQNQKYSVRDQSGVSKSFSIVHPPDPSIATAVMTAHDTVQVKGISAGETTFTLQREGATAADTMTVVIGVSGNLPRLWLRRFRRGYLSGN